MNIFTAPTSGEPINYEIAVSNAETINNWWHRNGYPQVQAWVTDANVRHDGAKIWGVTSNLRNGLPEGANPADIAKLYRSRFSANWRAKG